MKVTSLIVQNSNNEISQYQSHNRSSVSVFSGVDCYLKFDNTSSRTTR